MSSDSIHFRNAPITEALIDIRVKPVSMDLCEKLKELPGKYKNLYGSPKPAQKQHINFAVNNNANEPLKVETSANYQYGFTFISKNRSKVLQLNQEGFTLSFMRPYSKWEIFRNEGKDLFEFYQSSLLSPIVTRLALRYINHIPIPMPIVDLNEYLTCPPSVPRDLPQELSQFLTETVIKYPNDTINARIAQHLAEHSREQNIISILLDIDVFKNVELKADSGEIWETLELLRNLKNDIFLKSLTAKCKELFK